MIDRLRLSGVAKNQLSNIKRKTGIEHYNIICRHALCLSLANPATPPVEIFDFNGGLEIEWKTFTSGNEILYYNIILIRLLSESKSIDVDNVRLALSQHVHRGLAYLASRVESDLAVALAKNILEVIKK